MCKKSGQQKRDRRGENLDKCAKNLVGKCNRLKKSQADVYIISLSHPSLQSLAAFKPLVDALSLKHQEMLPMAKCDPGVADIFLRNEL